MFIALLVPAIVFAGGSKEAPKEAKPISLKYAHVGVLFLVSDIAKVPIKSVIKDCFPYFVPLLGTLLIITYVPQVVMWIPNMLK